MTKIPPYFAAQMEEQKKWDEGFKAGISEVLSALDDARKDDDLEAPTNLWVDDFKQIVSNKYL